MDLGFKPEGLGFGIARLGFILQCAFRDTCREGGRRLKEQHANLQPSYTCWKPVCFVGRHCSL